MNRSRARLAAVIGGIEYQVLVTLSEALQSLLPDSDTIAIDIEVAEAGNLDDVVVHYANGATRYIQVKHAVDASTALDTGYLLDTRTRTHSILQRIYESYQSLETSGCDVALELVTDRDLHPDDPLLKVRDQRTALLVPAAMNDRPKALVSTRNQWTGHLGCTDQELHALLSCLQIHTGRLGLHLAEHTALVAKLLGWRSDPEAVARGCDYVREWIQSTERYRTVGRLRTDLSTIFGPHGEPAQLVIHAIDRLPEAEEAAWVCDWVDLFDGDDAETRRDLKRQQDWEERIKADLQQARSELRHQNHTDVLVRYAALQATIFIVGFYLRRAAQFELTFPQRGQLWSSAAISTTTAPVARADRQFDNGPDLALVMAIALDATDDVVAYIESTGLPVKQVTTLSEASGPDQIAVTTPEHAANLALELVKQTREVVAETQPPQLHLFLAGPGAIAGLIGHQWNALPPTVVYEHKQNQIYVPTLEVGR